MSEIKTIGILTSGGDAPGMNAAIRAVARTAMGNGMKVMGIKRGYHGLLRGEIEELTSRDVSDVLQRGGTFLQTARSQQFATEEGVKKAVDVAKIFGIDAIVVIGGDGSFKGARALANNGIATVGIPGTIDNDIGCTDYTIGYDTALNTAMEAIDKIRDTASSHERCSVVEVMGRNAGYIPISLAIANGAEAVLIPEFPYDLDDIKRTIIEGRNRGKRHYIVIVSEGIGGSDELCKTIEASTGIETRATVLGYMQRGGNPSVRDRVKATKMGAYAANLLANGIVNRVVVQKNGKICDIEINEALETTKTIDKEELELVKQMSI